MQNLNFPKLFIISSSLPQVNCKDLAQISSWISTAAAAADAADDDDDVAATAAACNDTAAADNDDVIQTLNISHCLDLDTSSLRSAFISKTFSAL